MSLCANSLSVSLGKRVVVDQVSAALTAGRITAIIGPNGAGKTSLIRALAGLSKPSSGNVTLDGVPLTDLSTVHRAQQIGYLAQVNQPYWNVTASELVALGRLPHRSAFAGPSPADDAAVAAALAATNTSHLASRPIDQMSGGEQARVKLARVLAGDPDWILADEPLANLDPPHRRDVLALFRQAADHGKGVAIVLHQLSTAADIADDLIIMRDGKIIAAGPKADTLTPENLRAAFDMDFDVFTRADRLIVAPITAPIG
jgi:iron complex transport system ATP-binding protein